MASDSYQNVLWLQVSVEHILLVKNFKRLHYFDYVKWGHSFSEFVSLTQEIEQLSPHAEIHYEEKLGFVLESPVEINDEIGLSLALAINLDLSDYGGGSHAGKKVLFVHHLNGVHLSAVLFPRHKHLRIASFSYQLQELKVVNSDIGRVPPLFYCFLVGLKNFVILIRLWLSMGTY